MREAILDLRRLLAGEGVEFGPTSTRLRNRSVSPTPVYLLAAGPRMIELAGEVADGVFLMVGLHPAGVRAASSSGGWRPAGWPLAYRLSGGIRDYARSRVGRRRGNAMGAELVRSRSALSELSERVKSALAQASRLRTRRSARSCCDT